MMRSTLLSIGLAALTAPAFGADLSITIRGTLGAPPAPLPAPFENAVAGDLVLLHGSIVNMPDLSMPDLASYPIDIAACSLTIGGVTEPLMPSPLDGATLLDDLSFGVDRVAFAAGSPWPGGLILARIDDPTQTWFNGNVEIANHLGLDPGPIDPAGSFINVIAVTGPVMVRIDDFRFGEESAVTPVCVGDGSGSPCPCANLGDQGQGCANSTGAGAQLTTFGSTSVAADDMGIWADQLPAGTPAVLFMGQTSLGGGNGLSFGAGMRCPGRGLRRLGVRTSGMDGRATWEPGFLAGSGALGGETRFFQVWYADSQGSPCMGTSFNTSPAHAITMNP